MSAWLGQRRWERKRSRRYSQTRSIALSSGEYAGRKTGVRLAGPRVRGRCASRRELVEHRLHGGGADRGQHQGDAGVARRTDRAEQVDRLVAQVAHAARAHALLEPAPADAAGLADPGLVEEPDLEPLGLGVVAGDRGDQRREFFLKRAWALRSASGCIGRACCQDRSRSWSTRSMPFSV